MASSHGWMSEFNADGIFTAARNRSITRIIDADLSLFKKRLSEPVGEDGIIRLDRL